MANNLDSKLQQYLERSVEEADEEALRKKQKLAQSIEETRRENLEALIEAIKERSVFFSNDSFESQDQKKTKLNLVEGFCRELPLFNDAVKLLEETANLLKLPVMAKSVAEGLDSFATKHFSSPEKNPYDLIRVRGFNPKEIKLNGQENLVDQLKAKGANLESIDARIEKCTRYLDKKRSHFIPIILPDGRVLTLDINQYDRDKEQLEESQKSNQEQPASKRPIKGILKKPAPNYFAERNSENQEKRFEEKTPTTIPNYLPEQLSGFKPAFQASNNKEQTVAEGPPLGPKETPEQPVAEGPQKRENSPTNDTPYYLPTPLPKNQTSRFEEKTPNAPADLGGKTDKTGVTWAEKMEQVRLIPGRESKDDNSKNFSR